MFLIAMYIEEVEYAFRCFCCCCCCPEGTDWGFLILVWGSVELVVGGEDEVEGKVGGWNGFR